MKNDELTITKENNQDSVKIFINGQVNYYALPLLQNELDETLKNGKTNIILDMSRTEYLCSSGVSLILKCYKDARKAGGKLAIQDPSEHARKVLVLMALDEILIQS